MGLGVRAIQLGFSVRYFRFDELLTALKVASATDTVAARSPSVSNAWRLYRSHITTNKSIRDWTELLAGDEVLAPAIVDRLLHRAQVLNIRGRSYRLRNLEEALKG